MKTFELRVEQRRRRLQLEPQQDIHTFKIFAADPVQDRLDHERPRSVDMSEEGCLGTMTVRGENDFFDVAGALTGQELQSIAAQVIYHPSFHPQTS